MGWSLLSPITGSSRYDAETVCACVPEAAQEGEEASGTANAPSDQIGAKAVLHGGSGAADAAEADRLVFAEKFRFLATRMHRLREQRNIRTVLVTSAVPKDGKTVVAANLAMVLARGAETVLLVDGDLRGPSLHKWLGRPGTPGLAQILSGSLPVAESVHRLEPPGLYYVPAGDPAIGVAEQLQETSKRQLLATGFTSFGWVILDSPPVCAFADAHYLAMMSDTVLFVARAHKTPRSALREAVSTLKDSHIAGVVLNGNDEHRPQSYYRHYSRPAEELPHRRK